MNELTLDGKDYVSSKRAAEITGYAKDYVGQLCREGRVEARLVGRNWYILKSAIQGHRFIATGEGPVSTDEDTSSKPVTDTWEAPRYETEPLEELPRISLASNLDPDEQTTSEEIVEPQSALESMQDAWKGWFNRDEIVAETSKESESDEVPVTIHSIDNDGTKRQTLNLRHIREYEVDESIDMDSDVKITEWAVETRTRSGYGVVKILFIAVALFSLAFAYVGSGLLGERLSSYKPVNQIAGVSVYNK